MYVKKTRAIPIEFICRYYAAGSIIRLFPTLVSEDQEFENVLLKFDYKQDIDVVGVDDSTLNESYIVGLNILNQQQLSKCIELSKKFLSF